MIKFKGNTIKNGKIIKYGDNDATITEVKSGLVITEGKKLSLFEQLKR